MVFSPEEPTVTGGSALLNGLCALFARLLDLSGEDVLRVVAE